MKKLRRRDFESRINYAIKLMQDAGTRVSMIRWQFNVDDYGRVQTPTKLVCSLDELHECGTMACFAGTLALSSRWRRAGGTIGSMGRPIFYDSTTIAENEDAILKFLVGTDFSYDPLDSALKAEMRAIIYGKFDGGNIGRMEHSEFYGKVWGLVNGFDVAEKLEIFKTRVLERIYKV